MTSLKKLRIFGANSPGCLSFVIRLFTENAPGNVANAPRHSFLFVLVRNTPLGVGRHALGEGNGVGSGEVHEVVSSANAPLTVNARSSSFWRA